MNAKQFLETYRTDKNKMDEMLNACYHYIYPDSRDTFQSSVIYDNGKYIAVGLVNGDVQESKMLELADIYLNKII